MIHKIIYIIIFITLSLFLLLKAGLPESLINRETHKVVGFDSKYEGMQVVSTNILYSPTILRNGKEIEMEYKHSYVKKGEYISIYVDRDNVLKHAMNIPSIIFHIFISIGLLIFAIFFLLKDMQLYKNTFKKK